MILQGFVKTILPIAICDVLFSDVLNGLVISSVTETRSSELRVLSFKIGIDPAASGFIFLCWKVNVLSWKIKLPSSEKLFIVHKVVRVLGTVRVRFYKLIAFAKVSPIFFVIFLELGIIIIGEGKIMFPLHNSS